MTSIIAFFSTPMGMLVLSGIMWGLGHKFGIPDALKFFGKTVDPRVDIVLNILGDIKDLLENDPVKEDAQKRLDEIQKLVVDLKKGVDVLKSGGVSK